MLWKGGRGGEKFGREERFDGEMLVERVEEVKGGVLCT